MAKDIVNPSQPPSYADVVHLVGDVDDTVITAILETRASYGEIEEAVMWATGDAEQLGKTRHEMDAATARVYDILMADPAYAPEAER